MREQFIGILNIDKSSVFKQSLINIEFDIGLKSGL